MPEITVAPGRMAIDFSWPGSPSPGTSSWPGLAAASAAASGRGATVLTSPPHNRIAAHRTAFVVCRMAASSNRSCAHSKGLATAAESSLTRDPSVDCAAIMPRTANKCNYLDWLLFAADSRFGYAGQQLKSINGGLRVLGDCAVREHRTHRPNPSSPVASVMRTRNQAPKAAMPNQIPTSPVNIVIKLKQPKAGSDLSVSILSRPARRATLKQSGEMTLATSAIQVHAGAARRKAKMTPTAAVSMNNRWSPNWPGLGLLSGGRATFATAGSVPGA